jgi:tetratricopeptide (TPR) repeat protein
MEAGDTDAALAALKRSVLDDPSLATAHAAIGDVYRQRNDLDNAVLSYEAAVQANPQNFRNQYQCGWLHQGLYKASTALEGARRHLQRAVELYIQAVALRADDYDTLVNLSWCYYHMGEYDKAEEFCKKAIAVSDSQAAPYTNLGAIYARQGKSYPAISMYRQSLERDGNQGDVLMSLAAIYDQLGNLKAAMRDYEMAAKLMPNAAAPLERLGYCHYKNDDYDKAQQYYEAAVAAQPRFAAARSGLGVVYMTKYRLNGSDTEMRDRALTEWNASLEIQPDQPELIRLVEKYSPKTGGGPSL